MAYGLEISIVLQEWKTVYSVIATGSGHIPDTVHYPVASSFLGGKEKVVYTVKKRLPDGKNVDLLIKPPSHRKSQLNVQFPS